MVVFLEVYPTFLIQIVVSRSESILLVAQKCQIEILVLSCHINLVSNRGDL
jgi:hypothetical protein